MEPLAQEILARFEARADEIAASIAAATVAEVDGFRAIGDEAVYREIQVLARKHLDAYIQTVRSSTPPATAILQAARERAAMRAREMLPLAAVVHSYLIAQRTISAAITREAGADSDSREAALWLIATTFDYNIALTSAVAEAYLEVVQGDLVELNSARRVLLDDLLRSEPHSVNNLSRRATALGLRLDQSYVCVVAVVDSSEADVFPHTGRWIAQAMARSSNVSERAAFVVNRERDVVALLDANPESSPRAVLEHAAAAVKQSGGSTMRAGGGPPFIGLSSFGFSYQEARRALKHTAPERPIVFTPDDVGLFDELTVSRDDDATQLIPEAMRSALADQVLRGTLEAYVAANLNVADAAASLSLHPNSLRYRLKRIAERTGRDPTKVADLLELIAASRLLPATAGSSARRA
jgi:hypothetical protein